MEINKIKIFSDLNTWKEGHKFVIMVYEAVNKFPEEEKFGLTSQMKRAAVSVTSNIAEGFSRYSFVEKIRFYYISQGSVTELQNQMIIAKDLKYLDKEAFDKLINQSTIVHKLINGLVKASRLKTAQIQNS
jgi:four helix bundle protein